MPWGAVTLRPGVDAEKTLSLNEAGISDSQTIRFRDGLVESMGGWTPYVNFTVPAVVRDLHPWQDINAIQRLGIAGTTALTVVSNGAQQTITPQTTTTNPAPLVSITNGSSLATITDTGSNGSIYNTIYLNTPISVGGANGYLLNGGYQIKAVSGTSAFSIDLGFISSFTTSSGRVPLFSISSGTQNITVTLSDNGFTGGTGLFQQFIAPTQVGTSSNGILVQGKYAIASIIDSTNFTVNATVQASTTVANVAMNGGNAQIVYYVTLGPTVVGTGYGAGGYGAGGYGSGAPQSGTPGTPITATDWTQDNWGEVLLACPKDGPIYSWSADSGFQNAQVVATAPFFNGGIFVAMPQQILVAWRSVQASGVQDQLIVRWSNQGDYTNWAVTNQTTAGSFHIPTGSYIVGGIQCPQFALISTDLDVWNMSYVGGVVIFNFSRIGSGCGWISSHACGILSGNPFWMSNNNFFTVGANGVVPLPCPVWDQVFQNLNAAFVSNIRVAVNSLFNEILWLYPSATSTGENDSYVKLRLIGQEYVWDFGSLVRTAWTDVSVLGNPIGVDTNGQLYQHEVGYNITGAGLPTFQTGFWTIAEGEEIPFIDLIIPDFRWGTASGTNSSVLSLTFYGTDYPGDTPIMYGPYLVTQATEYINVRIRNRLLSVLVQSGAPNEFWRVGKIRFRFARSGRR